MIFLQTGQLNLVNEAFRKLLALSDEQIHALTFEDVIVSLDRRPVEMGSILPGTYYLNILEKPIEAEVAIN